MLLSKERRREMKNPIQKRVLEGTKRARKKKTTSTRIFSSSSSLSSSTFSKSFIFSLSLSLDGDTEEDVCVRDVDVFCALFSSLLK